MRVIEVPAPAVLDNAQKPFCFSDFLQTALDGYPPCGKGPKQIRQAAKIAGVLESLDGTKTLSLEDADYEVVHQAIEAMAWNPSVARRIVPFFDAVEKAQTC